MPSPCSFLRCVDALAALTLLQLGPMLRISSAQAMNDRFHYDALVDDALRSVVRRVLRQVADKGLPGSHHFYISFRSTDPGVTLPEYLRAKYPEEMTIVLQHQYWDLIIGEETFEWSQHDVFTIPHWTFARHEARGGDADLFMVTDKSAFERLDLVREEME